MWDYFKAIKKKSKTKNIQKKTKKYIVEYILFGRFFFFTSF